MTIFGTFVLKVFETNLNFRYKGVRILKKYIKNRNSIVKNFSQFRNNVKFIYSKKATSFCKNSTLDLSYVVTAKSTMEISQNVFGFSEYKNFNVSSKWR